jgi:hypothetical protein
MKNTFSSDGWGHSSPAPPPASHGPGQKEVPRNYFVFGSPFRLLRKVCVCYDNAETTFSLFTFLFIIFQVFLNSFSLLSRKTNRTAET